MISIVWEQAIKQLPKLSGSEKQVKWATSLRKDLFIGLVKWAMSNYDAHRSQVSDEEYDKHENDVLLIARSIFKGPGRSEAKFWIDNCAEAVGSKFISQLRTEYNKGVLVLREKRIAAQ